MLAIISLSSRRLNTVETNILIDIPTGPAVDTAINFDDPIILTIARSMTHALTEISQRSTATVLMLTTISMIRLAVRIRLRTEIFAPTIIVVSLLGADISRLTLTMTRILSRTAVGIVNAIISHLLVDISAPLSVFRTINFNNLSTVAVPRTVAPAFTE